MGFFDFLKSKPKKQEPVVEEISLKEINSWIEDQNSLALNEIKSVLHEIQEKISSEKSTLEDKIKTLETAELKNQKIPDRAKQAMEGNRETYIQKLSAFLEKFDFPVDPEKTEEFHDHFDKELNNFEKTIARNHAVVEQFFGEKAGAILISMKKLDKLVKEAQTKVKESELNKVKLIKAKVTEFNKSLKRKESLKKEIEFSQEDLKKSLKRIEDQESELEILQKDERYLEILDLQNQLQVLEKNLESHNSQIKHSFSEIESALKKYENLSENKTARKYLENPLSAISQDSNLEIAGILSATLTAIKQSEIQIKDKKKDKIINELNNLTRDFLTEFMIKKKELQSKISEIKNKLSSSEITGKIDQLKEEISNNKIKLKDKKFDLHEKQKDFEKIEQEELKTKLEDQINSVLENKQVKLI